MSTAEGVVRVRPEPTGECPDCHRPYWDRYAHVMDCGGLRPRDRDAKAALYEAEMPW